MPLIWARPVMPGSASRTPSRRRHSINSVWLGKQGGALGAATLAAIFVVAARNATLTLRNSIDPAERFGATMIVIVVITYLTAGMAGILIGHDILDSVLMVFLVSGTYLASGRQAALAEGQTLAPVTR